MNEQSIAQSSFLDHTEMVVALVAAVGTDQTTVIDELTTLLTGYNYSSQTLRLSDYLADQVRSSFRGKPLDEEIWEAMTAGDELRQKWARNDALALHAISDIVQLAKSLQGENKRVWPRSRAPLSEEIRLSTAYHQMYSRRILRGTRSSYGP